MLAEVS